MTYFYSLLFLSQSLYRFASCFFLSIFLFSLCLIHLQSVKSQPVVPAEQLQARETQMEMFVENNMCIIKV